MSEFDFSVGVWSCLMQGHNDSTDFPRPLLAHYCSMSTLESVIRGRELWLSNPLFMNDLDEVRFGINGGMLVATTHDGLKDALGDEQSIELFMHVLEKCYSDFSNEHAFDCYVGCFSSHSSPAHDDGRLSMWRAYGANGDGVALIFDVNSLSTPKTVGNGLLLAPVQYGSKDQRMAWLKERVDLLAKFLDGKILSQEMVLVAAVSLFERFKLMALFSKHSGFDEEQEWRLVYMLQRDEKNFYEGCLSYAIGARGIEPKFKLPLTGKVVENMPDVSLGDVVNKILLGPCVSNKLAVMSVSRMLEVNNLGDLKSRIGTSSIPLRPDARR